MEISILLMKQIIQLFIMIFFGFLLARLNIITSEESKTISKLSTFVICPCAIFSSFVMSFSQEIMKGLLIAFLGAIIVHIIFIPLTEIVSKVFQLHTVEKATLVYSNAGNLIIPLVGAILGEEWVIYTCGYVAVQTFLIWTHGKSTICGEKSISFKEILTSINIWAIVLGMAVFFLRIPVPTLLANTLDKVGSMLGPQAMIIIGILIGNADIKEILKDKRSYVICFGRLVVYPLIIIVAFYLLHLSSLSNEAAQVLLITILATSAPAAANIIQIAQIYNQDSKYASSLNVISVLFSIITMPLMVYIYQLVVIR